MASFGSFGGDKDYLIRVEEFDYRGFVAIDVTGQGFATPIEGIDPANYLHVETGINLAIDDAEAFALAILDRVKAARSR